MNIRTIHFGQCVVLVLVLLFLVPESASAHAFNYGVMETALTADTKDVLLHTSVPGPLPLGTTTKTIQEQFASMQSYIAENLLITNKGQTCPFVLTSLDSHSSSTRTLFDGKFSCQTEVSALGDLTIHSSLFANLFQSFDHFVTITIGNDNWIMAFSPEAQDYPKNVQALSDSLPSASPTVSSSSQLVNMDADGHSTDVGHTSFIKTFFAIFKQFILLGMFHIWTGYDHMLFLLSIILLLRSIKKILILVTSFTLAHSITLILAGLHIVTMSPKIVEPLIALTILYMAIRNFMLLKSKHDEHGLPERWVTTFGFGLVHGLGFAGALTDIGIPSAFFIPALVIFNIGIEIGQLCVLLVIVPTLLYIDSKKYRRPALMTLSVAIALLALFWVISRILLGPG